MMLREIRGLMKSVLGRQDDELSFFCPFQLLSAVTWLSPNPDG